MPGAYFNYFSLIKMNGRSGYILALICAVAALFACERYEIYRNTDARLTFSADTVLFDTVFTSIGSTTASLKVYNRYEQPLEISYIELAGGEQSVFRLNIDGVPGYSVRNLEIPAKDSIFIFVEITLDPNNMDSILLIQDSILFSTNGNLQDIDLMAWGQDVHILHREVLQTTTWTNEKPYLILDYLLVDSMQTLSIQEGVRVHLHRNAFIAVKGTIVARGSMDNPVIFQGDRLEQLYEDIPGQWDRIWFMPGHSRDNILEHVIIKNAVIGLQADSLVAGPQPTLTLESCRILNMSAAGILGSGTRIEASNTVVGNCGQFSLLLRWGGEYTFKHCTFANYWSAFSNRTTPGVAVVNYYQAQGGGTQVREFDGITFGNSIIYGNREFEFILDDYPGTETPYLFDHCLLKFDEAVFNKNDTSHFQNVLNLQNPLFMDYTRNDYRLDTLSPAKDAGLYEIALGIPIDLAGQDRLADGLPDIGAFERIEHQ